MATVDPNTSDSTSAGSATLRNAASTPSTPSAVVGAFAVNTAPVASYATTSVKVPPMSTPTITGASVADQIGLALPFAGQLTTLARS